MSTSWRSVRNNLAQLLEAANRLAEAEPLKRRALAILEPARRACQSDGSFSSG